MDHHHKSCKLYYWIMNLLHAVNSKRNLWQHPTSVNIAKLFRLGVDNSAINVRYSNWAICTSGYISQNSLPSHPKSRKCLLKVDLDGLTPYVNIYLWTCSLPRPLLLRVSTLPSPPCQHIGNRYPGIRKIITAVDRKKTINLGNVLLAFEIFSILVTAEFVTDF